MKKIKFNNRDPVYLQVIRQFKEDIATGILEPGQEIPSRRELANQLKINPNTAQRAYKEMEEAKLLYTERNIPSRITKDKAVLQAVREELITQAVDEFVQTVHAIQVPVDEVMHRVERVYDQKATEQGGTKHD